MPKFLKSEDLTPEDDKQPEVAEIVLHEADVVTREQGDEGLLKKEIEEGWKRHRSGGKVRTITIDEGTVEEHDHISDIHEDE
jgi:hypothetical protein